MISYRQLDKKIENFCNSHLQIKRYKAEFNSEQGNFATENKDFPIVFMDLVNTSPLEFTTIFTVDIYCWDIIEKDRSNLVTCLSDTNLIVRDIYNFIKFGDDIDYDILNIPSILPLNNGLLDYTVGNVLRVDIEVSNYCVTDIPIN